MGLIDELIKLKTIKTPEIIRAFRKVRREDFLPEDKKDRAENDAPVAIGFNQTNSQPTTVAIMFEELQPKAGDKILDVGCGSGWTTALLAEIAGTAGRVYGLELICELTDFALANASKYNYLEKGIAQIICADGYKGLPEHAPFDKILVSAGAEEVPENLLSELKPGGRMVIPVGSSVTGQELVIIDKIGENNYKENRIPGFIFVPLIKK